MRLKRLYNKEAPAAEWSTREDPCATCATLPVGQPRLLGMVPEKGRGVVVNATGDGVMPCPTCAGAGMVTKKIPPITGVTILRAEPVQQFTPRFVELGVREGWLSLVKGHVVVHGDQGDVRYKIVRTPGRYPVAVTVHPAGYEVIHYYDTVRVKEG